MKDKGCQGCDECFLSIGKKCPAEKKSKNKKLKKSKKCKTKN